MEEDEGDLQNRFPGGISGRMGGDNDPFDSVYFSWLWNSFSFKSLSSFGGCYSRSSGGFAVMKERTVSTLYYASLDDIFTGHSNRWKYQEGISYVQGESEPEKRNGRRCRLDANWIDVKRLSEIPKLFAILSYYYHLGSVLLLCVLAVFFRSKYLLG